MRDSSNRSLEGKSGPSTGRQSRKTDEMRSPGQSGFSREQQQSLTQNTSINNTNQSSIAQIKNAQSPRPGGDQRVRVMKSPKGLQPLPIVTKHPEESKRGT